MALSHQAIEIIKGQLDETGQQPRHAHRQPPEYVFGIGRKAPFSGWSRGKRRLDKRIATNVVLASACLPMFVRAVEVRGRPMWDSGYSGTPALWLLVRHTDIDDILIVQINPVDVDRPPETARDIANRIDEITFTS